LIAKARETLGWVPEVALRNGLRETRRWLEDWTVTKDKPPMTKDWPDSCEFWRYKRVTVTGGVGFWAPSWGESCDHLS